MNDKLSLSPIQKAALITPTRAHAHTSISIYKLTPHQTAIKTDKQTDREKEGDYKTNEISWFHSFFTGWKLKKNNNK